MAERRAIFLSYRREDEPGYAQSLYLMLEQAFGPERIFKDIEGGFQPGDDFPDEIRRRVKECDVLLAVIGPRWLTATTMSGGGAGFPRPEDFPKPLKLLVHKNAENLSNERFVPEARALTARIDRLLEAAEFRQQAPRRAAVERARQERLAWEVVDRSDKAAVEAFLREFPDGVNAHAARRVIWWATSSWLGRLFDGPSERDGESLREFAGHEGPVWSVAFSPIGATALSASGDATIRLWHIATGRCLRIFSGHASSGVSSVAFSPDGKTALSGGGGELRVWNVATGKPKRRGLLAAHEHRVESVAFSPDSKTALTGGRDKTPKLWDIAAGACLRSFLGHQNWVTSVAIAPDGKTALSGSEDRTLRLWDLATGECLQTLIGHTKQIFSVAFSPDGKRALSGSEDRTLRLWDLATGVTLHTLGGQGRTFTGNEGPVHCVAVSPDGTLGLSGSSYGALRLWDLAAGECLRRIPIPGGSVLCAAFSPDGRTVLSGSADGRLRLWDLSTV